jgi:hypothetical protein
MKHGWSMAAAGMFLGWTLGLSGTAWACEPEPTPEPTVEPTEEPMTEVTTPVTVTAPAAAPVRVVPTFTG